MSSRIPVSNLFFASVYFIDALTNEQINLTLAPNNTPCFVTSDGKYNMKYSAEENDWIITNSSVIEYRWKTNWPVTGINEQES